MGPVGDHALEPDESVITLPSLTDLTAAEPLRISLLERLTVADSIAVLGADVEQVSTAVIQVLLAAARDARSRGVSFRLDAPSSALASAFTDLGLTVDTGI